MGELKREDKRIIIHIDLDYFYAQCEELKNISLKDKPLVVCVHSGRKEDSGAIVASNYIARAYGVKAGIPIIQAKRLLKDVKDSAFLPADFDYYEEKSRRIMEIIRAYGDKFEEASIDEAFLDVSKVCHLDFDKALELSKEIKKEIYEKENITCSIGIGPNKLIAKMASDYRKPNGLTLVKPDEVKSFLFPLPVGKLYGIGKKTESRLLELKISTIGELANFDLDKLTNLFGKKLGTYFYLAANGIDDEEVLNRESREISRIVTLKENTLDFEEIVKVLDELVKDVHLKMLEQGLACKSIGILAVMEDLKTRSKGRSLDNPINSLEVMNKWARELLKEFLSQDLEFKVRRIGFKASNLFNIKDQSLITQFIESQ
ncbi:MAG: DNA polymerase IV [Nitrososphaerales archaeon]